MTRPCLCGAPDCDDCGPAQGYTRCKLHGKFACYRCKEFLKQHGYYPKTDSELEDYEQSDNSEEDE